MNTVKIEWLPVSELPPRCGWYLGMLLPANHAVCEPEGVQQWREKFGFAKVWYNPAAVEKWWCKDQPPGRNSVPVDHRITHWAFPVQPPPMGDKIPSPAKEESPMGWAGFPEERLHDAYVGWLETVVGRVHQMLAPEGLSIGVGSTGIFLDVGADIQKLLGDYLLKPESVESEAIQLKRRLAEALNMPWAVDDDWWKITDRFKSLVQRFKELQDLAEKHTKKITKLEKKIEGMKK